VAPERLAAHLGLALLLFSGIVWTALDAWFGSREDPQRGASGWVWASATLLIAAFMQCLAGALVAGNHAGLIDADWPLMGGRLFPHDYWGASLWGTLAHSLPAVQFNHRALAYGLLAGGLAMAAAARVRKRPGGSLPQLTLVLACLLFFQVALGIVTLVLTVPLPMALLHQFAAVVVLALATIIAWKARRI
jgi:cytochrome c oxidase assembly protein subunit 15